ncbi:MAG TPA: hypothetical protein VGR70_10115 [Stellaceae bacterium]|nr:hypothetical protein [Stellaceae bacterium]
MEDLVQFLDEVVEPTIADFEANPTSRRHAFLACVATFHGVDYLAHPRKPQLLRQKFNKASPEFALIDRVAHAFKHVVSGHEASPQRPRLKAAEVIPRPPAFWGTTMVWGLSRWGDAVGGVTLDQDREVDLLTILKSTVAFLRAQ